MATKVFFRHTRESNSVQNKKLSGFLKNTFRLLNARLRLTNLQIKDNDLVRSIFYAYYTKRTFELRLPDGELLRKQTNRLLIRELIDLGEL